MAHLYSDAAQLGTIVDLILMQDICQQNTGNGCNKYQSKKTLKLAQNCSESNFQPNAHCPTAFTAVCKCFVLLVSVYLYPIHIDADTQVVFNFPAGPLPWDGVISDNDETPNTSPKAFLNPSSKRSKGSSRLGKKNPDLKSRSQSAPVVDLELQAHLAQLPKNELGATWLDKFGEKILTIDFKKQKQRRKSALLGKFHVSSHAHHIKSKILGLCKR